MIKYNGERYRDARMYVINLTYGKVGAGKNASKWILVTYRNTERLPIFRSDTFENKGLAIEYLKRIEPTTPLITDDEKPLLTPEEEDGWLYWLEWLKNNNLFSAISETQHMPYWKDPRGYNYLTNYFEIL